MHKHKCTTTIQYSLACPHLDMTKAEKNRVIRTDIIKLDNGRTWITPTTSLVKKMAHHKAHVLHTSDDEFIIRPSYLDIHPLWQERYIIAFLNQGFRPLWEPIMLGALLSKTKRQKEKLLSNNKTTSSSTNILQVNQGLHKQAPDQDIVNVLQQIK